MTSASQSSRKSNINYVARGGSCGYVTPAMARRFISRRRLSSGDAVMSGIHTGRIAGRRWVEALKTESTSRSRPEAKLVAPRVNASAPFRPWQSRSSYRHRFRILSARIGAARSGEEQGRRGVNRTCASGRSSPYYGNAHRHRRRGRPDYLWDLARAAGGRRSRKHACCRSAPLSDRRGGGSCPAPYCADLSSARSMIAEAPLPSRHLARCRVSVTGANKVINDSAESFAPGSSARARSGKPPSLSPIAGSQEIPVISTGNPEQSSPEPPASGAGTVTADLLFSGRWRCGIHRGMVFVQ